MSGVIVSLRVKVSSREAFDAFTEDIAIWWRPSGLFQLTPRGDGVLSFENHERLITTLANGQVFEIGRISIWQPGERLAFTWRQASFAPDQLTYVDVRFEPIEGETRITIEHRGWDAIPQDHAARHGFPLAATQMRLAEHWRAALLALGQVSAIRTRSGLP